ncbi:hypothetical protein NW762_005289 [Fusarium torreyae]|uniref:Uncharacterized protein n=1 Tax=Fusarium torreyae TaxID=1237075 RepID=A0A9W8S4F7_9HYPO|nr:hypothetical protein NW762_005289 [Fusarium torreyae]
MWDAFFYRGGFILSLIPGYFGLNSMLRPEAMMKAVEFPVPTDPQNRKLTFALMRIYGSRNVVIAYLFALNALNGDKRHMGLGMIGTLFMLVTDGLVSRSLIGGKEWYHWSFIPVYIGFIGGLLYTE